METGQRKNITAAMTLGTAETRAAGSSWVPDSGLGWGSVPGVQAVPGLQGVPGVQVVPELQGVPGVQAVP